VSRRRASGEGGVYRYRNGWAGQLDLGADCNGRRRRRTLYGRTQREVLDKLRDLRRKQAAGLPVDGTRLTVATHLAEWVSVTLPGKVAVGELSPTTLDSYRDNVALHITPYLGNYILSRDPETPRRLRPADVRAWRAQLIAKPLSGRRGRRCRNCRTDLGQVDGGWRNGGDANCERPEPTCLSTRTVAYVMAILSSAMSDAVNDELVDRNVVELVDAPRSSATST
jgi:hypothetical protein